MKKKHHLLGCDQKECSCPIFCANVHHPYGKLECDDICSKESECEFLQEGIWCGSCDWCKSNGKNL